ncbi:MAG: hypothetical protein H6Q30_277 [Bacteroidetes bacterium]|nr:hypothetical protein [Bacteroidota bacterium]
MTSSTRSGFILSFFTLAAVVVLLSCAGQIPPPGGPVDVVPPEVIRTVPDTNAVRVETNSIELEFSKYVDRRSVEESIFISPYVGDLEFDWSGTSVAVRFTQALRRNTTYVVNIGTDVKDRRAGNRMARGFTLAFASGDSIDRGAIRGRVYDEKPEGVMIFAYALGGINPDTLNPATTRPDYIMQTGLRGTYSLSHLSYNRYRVFAVRDQYRDLVYDKQTDQCGVASEDVVLSAQRPEVHDVNFQLSEEDTTRPFLTAVRALDRRHLVLGFSEPIDSLTFGRGEFLLSDTATGESVPIALQFLRPGAPSNGGILTVSAMDSGAGYRLTVRKISDRAGNPVDSLHASGDFAGNGTPDTLRPQLVFSVKDSARGISPDAPLRVTFSEPVDTVSLAHGLTLSDTGKGILAAELLWVSPVQLLIRPHTELRFNSWYRLRVAMDSVRDAEGNSYKDSTAVVRFQTLDLRTTGTVEGSVTDARAGAGRIVVTVAGIDATDVRRKSISIPAPGGFLLDQLPEGKYVVSAFRDADDSGTYSYGLPFPFKPAERFAVYQDSVKVRARWGVQGVVISLK